MPLSVGARVGPYEIVAPLGVGGMGEVYRAHDSRLGRDVAIKVIAGDAEAAPRRVRRFEDEARATSALNHPNILTVFDVLFDHEPRCIVCELLEGETFRERLVRGPLPVARAIDHAAQICQGLAAAHGKGIVHRDLKPDNLFITRDGRVKILDFGLARLTHGPDGADTGEHAQPTATQPGLLLGTPAYMSPEQARGGRADARSDIFSLGATIHEMVSGRPTFLRPSSAETLSAVLTLEPEALSSPERPAPPGLESIVRRCLAKDPEERFQSARDLGFALRTLSGYGSPTATETMPGWHRKSVAFGIVSVLLLGAIGTAAWQQRRSPLEAGPTFRRLTFRRGDPRSARFTPDGQTVVYGAAWDGGPFRLFTTRLDQAESRPLDLPNADLLAISPQGEMAICLDRMVTTPFMSAGTLARVPLGGGAPRPLLENVMSADWAPDGQELAVVHRVGGKNRVEFPIGNVVHEGWVLGVRVSPRGDLVAFRDPRGVSVVDRQGRERLLATDPQGLGVRLAWSPRGDEVWYTASEKGTDVELRSVTLGGRVGRHGGLPLFGEIVDIASDGRALMIGGELRTGVVGLPPGASQERDLSWLDRSSATALSQDGRTLLFGEMGVGRSSAIYLRRTDGTPAIRLGDGIPSALSLDSKWVLKLKGDASLQLTVLPTGAGEAKVRVLEGIKACGGAALFPDGQRLLFNGRQGGAGCRSFVLDVAEGPVRPVTPEGLPGGPISPDGVWVAVAGAERGLLLYPTAGGEPRRVPGAPEPGTLGPWSTDGRALYVSESEGAVARIFRHDLVSGRRELWKQVTAHDPAGLLELSALAAADGGSYVYSYTAFLGSLFLVEGLK